MLLLIIGCFLLVGYKLYFGTKDAALVTLLTFAALEIYSIAILLPGVKADTIMSGFLGSLWLDALFVIAVIVYCIIDREPEVAETAEKTGQEKRVRLHKLRENLQKNSALIVRFVGGTLCTLSLGLFLFYLVTTVAGTNNVGFRPCKSKYESKAENDNLIYPCSDKKLSRCRDRQPQ